MNAVILPSPPLDLIKRKIIEAFNPRRIILFGSHARGEDRAGSDVDLMVEMETALSPPKRAMAIDSLFGLRAWAMDVLVYTPKEVEEQRRYRNSMLRIIEAEGKVLYERPG